MRQLPIGITDFKKLISGNYHYVDKSLFIKELLDNAVETTLIPRPRRFGKTLNLSMLRYFFEKTEPSHAYLFGNLAIAKEPKYMQHQGQFPVIFLTFKFLDDATWDKCYDALKRVIANEFRRHNYLLTDSYLDKQQKQEFEDIIALTATEGAYKVSLKNLITYLAKYHNKNPIVLIDEYDVPIHAGFKHKYYEDVTLFMRRFIGDGLKDNEYLHFAVITGAMRITEESISTGLNHLKVCTLLNKTYSDKFGWLEHEVQSFIQERGLSCRLDDIRHWYNGFASGPYTIYNPWSTISCADNGGVLRAYWVNTASTDILKDLIAKSNKSVKEDIELLLQGNSIRKRINENITFFDLAKNETALWNYLFCMGYLTIKQELLIDDIPHADFCIPNKEIVSIYTSTILERDKGYTHIIPLGIAFEEKQVFIQTQ